jgi:hypothetical protein
MPGGVFRERDEGDHGKYLSDELAHGTSREQLIEGMERLLMFTKDGVYRWTDDYGALIYATVVRSARTYAGICMLLRAGLAVQAAVLTRTLFEDVIVAHWMVLNHEDRDWLVERFLRQREAIALQQRKLRKETGFSMGPPLSAPDDVEDHETELFEEFGARVSRDWWDPGREGRGRGKDVGLRKLVIRLENAAAEHRMFHPRFAGGHEPLLDRTDRVVNKWLSQCVHHTVVGLPFAPSGVDETEVSGDPMVIVGFSASWLFAQQVFLLHELEDLDFEAIDTVWYGCMGQFVRLLQGPDAAERLAEQWAERYGEDED